MAIVIKIEPVGLVPKTSLSKIRRLKTVALKVIARSWHQRYSAGKFTAAGARKYNYGRRKTKEVRTGKIKRGKGGRKLAPSGLPLVWKGDTRSKAKTRKIGGNSKRSYVTSPIQKLNFKPPGNRALNMRREYTTVLKSEQRVLGRDGEKFIRRQFSKNKKNVAVSVV